MRLPISLYDWKLFLLKSTSSVKRKYKRQFASNKSSSSPPLSPSSSSRYYAFRHKKKDPASTQKHSTVGDHATQQTLTPSYFYQLDELELAETTSEWEISTLQEMLKPSITVDNDYNSDKNTGPIKTKLEALALQRQQMKSSYMQEMADQARLETLHIQQFHPSSWSASCLSR